MTPNFKARASEIAYKFSCSHCTEEETEAQVIDIAKALQATYEEAIEAAGKIADGYCTDRTDDVASAIRALSERQL